MRVVEQFDKNAGQLVDGRRLLLDAPPEFEQERVEGAPLCGVFQRDFQCFGEGGEGVGFRSK